MTFTVLLLINYQSGGIRAACHVQAYAVIWLGRRLDRTPDGVLRLDRESLTEKVSIKRSRLSYAQLHRNSLFLYHTRYYIQSPCIPWPSLLVANARPHLAMTFSLVAPLLVGEGSVPLLRRSPSDWSRISFIRCVPTY